MPKHDLAIILGIGRPKGPPPRFGGDSDSDPNQGPQAAAAPAPGAANPGQKASPDEASCFGPDIQCASCEHFQPGDTPDLGTCSKVDGGSFGPAGDITGCVKYFELNKAAGAIGPGAPGSAAGVAPGSEAL